MKKCDNCGKSFEGKSHTPVDENFKPQKGVIYCEDCYTRTLVVADFVNFTGIKLKRVPKSNQ